MRHRVRNADIAGLAGFHDSVERFQRFVDRRRRIETVQLVKIDIIRLQPFQRRIDRIEDVLARHALVPGLGSHLAHAFRGEHVARALALQPTAENLLGASGRRAISTERIDIGRIEKIDTAFRSRIQDGDAVLFGALKPEIHRPEAEPGNAQAGPAEWCVVHGSSLAHVGAVAEEPATAI
jgi:hypothetical protein